MVNFHWSEGNLFKSITCLESYHLTPWQSSTIIEVMVVCGGVSGKVETGVVGGVGSGTGAS